MKKLSDFAAPTGDDTILASLKQNSQFHKVQHERSEEAIRVLSGTDSATAFARGSRLASDDTPKGHSNGNGGSVASRIQAALENAPKGLTVAQMHEKLGAGVPKNSIHSGILSLKKKGVKMATKPGPVGAALVYRLK